jgi:1-acyl-sn-glycerol-3-phosphate acyltransferase
MLGWVYGMLVQQGTQHQEDTPQGRLSSHQGHWILGLVLVYWGYRRSHRVRFLVRTLLFYVGLSSASLFGLCLAPLLYPLGLGGWSNYCVGRFTAFLLPKLLGVSVQVHGQDHLRSVRPCVFVANHQSSLDMLAMYNPLFSLFLLGIH